MKMSFVFIQNQTMDMDTYIKQILVYKCYSLPMYGGEARFENEYDNALDAFNEVLSWS